MKKTAVFFKGMTMGIADLVPGVSGGTVAFILNIHEKMMRSIKNISHKGDKNELSSIVFLALLVSGLALSLAFGSHIISSLLNNSSYQAFLKALFLGLVIGSIYFCYTKLDKWTPKTIFSLVIGAVLALVAMQAFQNSEKETLYTVPVQFKNNEITAYVDNYDFDEGLLKNVKQKELKALLSLEHLDPEAWVYQQNNQKALPLKQCFESNKVSLFNPKLIFCGSLAISAMLLPGVSGSQVMQVFGFYELVIHSIATWTKGLASGQIINDSFWVLLNVGLGIAIGLVLFARALNYLYQKYFNITMSTLIGFMLGSTASLWPFWSFRQSVHFSSTGVYLQMHKAHPIMPPVSLHTFFVICFFIIGVLSIILIDRKQTKLQTQEV